MARVNLERRAEIGREKRARTRALILAAARGCYADPAAPQVTVEVLTRAAGVAKGTFYVHFPDLNTLEAELGDEIIDALAQRHQAVLEIVSDPLTRIATVTMIFLRDLAQAPARARLVSHAVAALPDFAQAVQARLHNDLAEARDAGRLAVGAPGLAAQIVVTMVAQGAQMLGRGALDAAGVPDLVRALLRALGSPPDDAAARTETAIATAEAITTAEAIARSHSL